MGLGSRIESHCVHIVQKMSLQVRRSNEPRMVLMAATARSFLNTRKLLKYLDWPENMTPWPEHIVARPFIVLPR